MITRDYLIAMTRDRLQKASAAVFHYGQYSSACAQADKREKEEDVEFYALILKALEGAE